MVQQEQTTEKHVLVVDDDPDILDIVETILSNNGYRVQTSLNGACLQHLESEPPDLILLDVLLHGENGRVLCRQVKGREQTRHIPVILFSAHVTARSDIEACGADGCLAKPFRLEDLLAIVATTINPV